MRKVDIKDDKYDREKILFQLDEAERLKDLIELNDGCKFSIFPYGREGRVVHRVLEQVYDITPHRVFDNHKENCLPISELKNHPLDENEILILSVLTRNHKHLNEMLPENNVWELYPDKESSLMPEDTIWDISKRDVKFFLPYYDVDAIQGIIFNTDNYASPDDLAFLKQEIPKDVFRDEIVLDVGANIGNHSLFFVKECGAKKIYAFEPVPETFGILKKNVEINELEDIISVINAGVGAGKANASIASFQETDFGKTKIAYDESGELPIVALDDLEFDGKVGFIKIDVEGFETEVFAGAKNLITRDQPIVFCEIWPEYFDEHFAIISDMLNPLGYTCKGSGSDYLFTPMKQ